MKKRALIGLFSLALLTIAVFETKTMELTARIVYTAPDSSPTGRTANLRSNGKIQIWKNDKLLETLPGIYPVGSLSEMVLEGDTLYITRPARFLSKEAGVSQQGAFGIEKVKLGSYSQS